MFHISAPKSRSLTPNRGFRTSIDSGDPRGIEASKCLLTFSDIAKITIRSSTTKLVIIILLGKST
jgi:hypothetical protein